MYVASGLNYVFLNPYDIRSNLVSFAVIIKQYSNFDPCMIIPLFQNAQCKQRASKLGNQLSSQYPTKTTLKVEHTPNGRSPRKD